MNLTSSMKVLIVDDEPDLLEMLAYNLNKEGYQTQTAANGQQAIDKMIIFEPQLVLLDIMMPEMDGVEACRRIRKLNLNYRPHIIFLTARAEEYSEIVAFETGADDFIIKPIKPRALLSRIAAQFRKSEIRNSTLEQLQIGELWIDKHRYTVYKNEKLLHLPKKEFELLTFLAFHSKRAYSREDLLFHIWGSDVFVIPRTVDVHIRKVREKIGEGYIHTIKGIGYKFEYSGTK